MQLTKQRVVAARYVAIAADVAQWLLTPFVVEGAVSPLDDVLDVVVGCILCLLVGWHIAFLPSFLVKMLPVADLAPTWTIAYFIAMRGKQVLE
jgi:hypothetical protein